ncbi:MAG: TonB-dependent receptor [Bacteroidales bacterium]|jgi:outer membrane receptor for ferrienterochelin and colicins|nr:TonB-dependent receptor [Bacteroidales bacterium]MDD2264325.1 TonB-dependent receptor [Bacteroidales bacterium]MDD2831559.1 TonB-dependent receptor [Bacteroidales bacterium]MDD3208553.1 TonB-dependent receptor [Bacteroidales bacterium]MDD3697034.1 TonB-dependent receptor [Bacteroidales bacterium]
MKKYLFLFLCLFLSVDIFAQKTVTVTGNVVTTDGHPAENITVMINGTNYGGITDNKGNFEFNALPGNYKLIVFSIIHHKTEIPILITADKGNHFPDIKITENIQELQEVVITGTRTEKRLSEAPIQTIVISQREIQKAGAISTIETLQDHIPGLMVTPNAMGNNLRIKGLNSRYILMLVDGERLVSESAGGNINLDQINVNDIKRIEMVNGASSALYGSNAVGAVINIITKGPLHPFEAGVDLIAESNNTWKTKINTGFKQKKVSGRVSAFRNSSDGFGGDGESPYAAKYEDYGAQLKVGYQPTRHIDLNLNGRYFRHETFKPKESINVKHPLTHTFSIGANAGYVSADKRIKTNLSTHFSKYYDFDILEKKKSQARKNNTASFLSGRWLNTFTPDERWEFVGGAEYNHEKTFATKTLGAEPVTKSLNDVNLFAQVDYKPRLHFNILAGLRYTYNNQFKSALTPKLALMYRIKSGVKLRVDVGTAFRAPSIKELYYNFDHQGMFWVYGNPELKAEKGLYYSWSAEYEKSGFNASISVYHNKIKNKITQYEVINTSGKRELYYKNVSSATLRGIDVNISFVLLPELLLKANYSFCDARNDSTKLQILGNVKHSSTLSATWSGKIAQSPFSLQFAGRLSSPKIYQEKTMDNTGNETINTVKSKPFSVWKIVLVKPFVIKNHTVELTAKVDNIFQFREPSFVNPGRQYLIGLRYAFN